MGWSDGYMKNDHLYLTSDIALAAYLLMRGYELLGAVDTGNVGRNGRPRLEWGITSTDPELIITMEERLKDLSIQYDRSPERLFYYKIKELHHALDNPIKENDT